MFACSNSSTSDEPGLLGNPGNAGGVGAGNSGTGTGTGTGTDDGGIAGGLVVDASIANLAVLPSSVVGMFQLPGDVLFTTGADGVIRTVGTDGTITTVGPVLPRASQITADHTAVYVIVASTQGGSDGSIVSISRGTDATVTTLASALLSPEAITTDGTNLYWIDGGTGMGIRLASVPVGGSGSTLTTNTLASYSSFGTGANLYVSGSTAYFTVLQNSETQVFATTLGTTTLNIQATLVATQAGAPTGLAVDANDAFITTGGNAGALYELSRADAGAATITATSLVTAQSSPIGLTFIGTQLIWLDSVAGTLQAYDTLSGLPGQIATGFPNATATAVGDAFYVAYNDGVISSVTF